MNFKESMTWVLQAFSAQLSFFLWWWAVTVGLFLLKHFFLCSFPDSSNCYICSRRAPSQASGSAYLILLLDHKNVCCRLTRAPGVLLIVWDMPTGYYRAVVLCVCVSAVGHGIRWRKLTLHQILVAILLSWKQNALWKIMLWGPCWIYYLWIEFCWEIYLPTWFWHQMHAGYI